MKMKTRIGMLIIILFLGMIVIGCDSEPKGDSQSQYKITITGIPSTYNGRVGLLSISTENDGTIKAWIDAVEIKNNSLTGALMDWETGSPYSKAGNYFVTFGIHSADMDTRYWLGYISNRNISSETTIIAFTQFYSIADSVLIDMNIENIDTVRSLIQMDMLRSKLVNQTHN